MRRSIFLFACLCSLLLSACNDSENEYTIGACLVIIDNSVHQDPTLASAMNINAPGVFCTITKGLENGANKFFFSNNVGQHSSVALNALDSRRTLILGYNEGIIVGFGNLDYPARFVAYDRECPNCFDPNRIPIRSYALTTTSNGMAVCNTCKRKYDMNNGGNLVEGDAGKKLTRYRAATTGPYGKLSVN